MSAVVLARWCAGIGLGIGYILLAHYTNTTPGNETLGSAVALAPLLIAAASIAWRSPRRPVMLALFACGCLLLVMVWARIERHYSWLYWLEHAGTQLVLCMVFARTLAPGREAMCTYFARMVHGTLSPELGRYTRQVTVAWVIFFGLMACVSTVLFFAAPVAVWSAFANFFTAPLTCLMFVGEYAARRRLLPDMEHVHIMDAVKAFWKAPAGH